MLVFPTNNIKLEKIMRGIQFKCVNNFQLGFGENDSSSIQTIALPKTKGCLIEYQYIEVLHASIQIILAFVGVVLGGLLAHYYYTEVDVKRRKAKKSSHMYSIEYSPQVIKIFCEPYCNVLEITLIN